MLSLLRQRNYALLWSSALISGIDNYILIAALPYYVYAISGSTLASGATFVSETVPMVLFSSVGGIFADRWQRKRTIARYYPIPPSPRETSKVQDSYVTRVINETCRKHRLVIEGGAA
jgi:hypothetical protein